MLKFKNTPITTAVFIAVNFFSAVGIIFSDSKLIQSVLLCLMASVGLFYLYEIRKLHNHNQLLEKTAKHDALTGLLNRDSFNETLSNLLIDSQTKYFAVLIMDLNKFKIVNDTLGHQIGDELLKQVAARLKTTLRPHDHISRLGGDEFALLLTKYESTDNLVSILGRLAKCFEVPFVLDDKQAEVGCSTGVSLYPNNGRNVTDLVKRADVAMYTAKNNHTAFFIYDKDLDASSFEAVALRSELRQAVDSGNLRLSYQPKKSLITGQIEGIEALARWTHPTMGEISPSTFIPIAEQTGLIRPLTNFVLFKAIDDFTKLNALGVLKNVSVNISPYSLSQGDLILHISKELSRQQVSPENLILEVTETALHKGTDDFIKILLCLDLLGLSISIDDFGTGQSSFVYLKSLPVKEIKIDQSFVRNLKEHKQDYAIVQHIITLAHSVGCTVCAEGVEDRQTEDLLRDLGCDLVQGYYIAKPMSVYDLPSFLGVGK